MRARGAGAPAGARRLAVRTAIGLATLGMARYVPFLAYFMSLIGSLLTVSVSIIFPALCHLRIFQARALQLGFVCWAVPGFCEPPPSTLRPPELQQPRCVL